jgi:hypothetical protein
VKAAALYVAVLKDKKGEIHMDYFLGKEPGSPSLPYACTNDEGLHQYLVLFKSIIDGIISFLAVFNSNSTNTLVPIKGSIVDLHDSIQLNRHKR